MPEPKVTVAWISRGRLFVKRGEADVQEIESDFATSSLAREQRHSQNNAWKGRSGVWGGLGMEPPGMAPWMEGDEQKRQIRFVTAAKGDTPDEIYYVLDLGPVGGLFKYDMELDEETRLMHSQGFLARDLSRHPESKELAVSVRREDGTMGITITRHDGLFGKAVTMSDTIDEAPSWLPDGTKRLVFQSSAIGRDEEGRSLGKTTCRIELMDLEEEEITKLHEEDEQDLLQPRMLDDESVLFIRRPYRTSHRKPPTLMEVAEDVVLFPFRLARTIVYFFNFMSMAFTGKPLMTAGGPEDQKKRANRPLLMLYGQAVDTEKAIAQGAGKDKDRPLVPKEWQLVSKSKGGSEETLAENVIAFDSAPNGTIVYSDGRGIFLRSNTGDVKRIADGEFVEKVVLLNGMCGE